MNVLYDYQIFENQKFGGVSRYFFELLSRYKKSCVHSYKLPLRLSSNDYIKDLGEIKKQITGGSDFYNEFFWGLEFKGKHRIYTLHNKLFKNFSLKNNKNKQIAITFLKEGRFDIFHPTYYDPYFLKYIGNKPFVLTVYDMIHELYPECFSKDDKTAENKKILCKEASTIIAISENTKNDLIKIHGIKEDKIRVIYLGSSFDNKGSSEKPICRDPYLLFVGNRTLYKNFNFYLKSVAEILISSKLKLVCAGGGSFTDSELRLIRDLNLQHLVIQIKIDNESLVNLYKNAIAFTFPSLYEGFGIPVLEAFSCGSPCLLSTGGSIPEVGGDAAVYFDPQNSNSIQQTLLKIIHDQVYRNNISLKGYERLKLFSWDKTFEETINLYESIA